MRLLQKWKLDNLYNESDYYLGYAPFVALKIDDKDIAAEVQFSFTGDEQIVSNRISV